MAVPVITTEKDSTGVKDKGVADLDDRKAAREGMNMDALFEEGDDAPAPEPKVLPSIPAKKDPEKTVVEEPVAKKPPKTLYAIPPTPVDEDDVVVVGDDDKKEGDDKPVVTDPEPPSEVTKLAEALKLAFPEKVEQPKKEEEVKLSDADYKRLMNVYEPAPDLFDRLSNADTRAAAMDELVSGIRKENMTLAYKLSQEMITDYKASVAAQQQTTQTVAEHSQNFFKKYEALNEERFFPVLDAVALKLKKAGSKYKDADEMYKTLAEETEKVLQGVNPEFSLKNKPKSTTIPKPTVTKSAGGGGGGGSKAKVADVQNAPGTEIFDK